MTNITGIIEKYHQIIQWAEDRNFFCLENGATILAQRYKLAEEYGELCAAIVRGRCEVLLLS